MQLDRYLVFAALVVVLSACGSTQRRCQDDCSAVGVTQCGEDGGVETCEKGREGCLEWSEAAACDSGKVCDESTGQCAACPGGCETENALRCAGAQIQACETQPDGCLAWGTPIDCPAGGSCDPTTNNCPTCVSTCTQLGKTRCETDQIETCQAGADNCFFWSNPTDCPSGQSCDPDQNKCVDPCGSDSALNACAPVAAKIDQCCDMTLTAKDYCENMAVGGLTASDIAQFCSDDANNSCNYWHGEYSSQVYYGASETRCCCPAGQTCNWSGQGECVIPCTTDADCTYAGGPDTLCTSMDVNDVIVSHDHLCQSTAIVGAGYPCKPYADPDVPVCQYGGFSDLACMSEKDTHDQYCTRTCSTDADCGNPGIACCVPMDCHDASTSCPSSGKGCAPCSTP